MAVSGIHKEVRTLLDAAWAVDWGVQETKKGEYLIKPRRGDVIGEAFEIVGKPGSQSSILVSRTKMQGAARALGITLPLGRAPKPVERARRQAEVRARPGRRKGSASLPADFQPKRFALALMQYRQREELSQARLGERLGLHQVTISGFERCIHQPSPDVLVEIQSKLGWADYYGTPAREIQSPVDPRVLLAEANGHQEPELEEEEEPEPEPLTLVATPPADAEAAKGYPKVMEGVAEMIHQLTEARKLNNRLLARNRELEEMVASLEGNRPRRRRRRQEAAVA